MQRGSLLNFHGSGWGKMENGNNSQAGGQCGYVSTQRVESLSNRPRPHGTHGARTSPLLCHLPCSQD